MNDNFNEIEQKLLAPKYVIKTKNGMFVLMEEIPGFEIFQDAKEKKFYLTDVNRNVKIKIVQHLEKYFLYKKK
jgi:hypothetical protein